MKKFSLHSDSIFIAALIIFICGLVGFLVLYIATLSAPQKTTGVCTQEAMICPDGSAVVRTGPNCTFIPCQRDGLPNRPGITEEPFLAPPVNPAAPVAKKK